MNNCIFCKIVSKEVPSSIVYEDEELLALKTIEEGTHFNYSKRAY